jgi:hypothetical protein
MTKWTRNGCGRRSVQLAMLTFVLAAAGCGSSSHVGATGAATTATATATLPKAEFIAKANAICESANASLATDVVKLAGHPSRTEAAQIISGSFLPAINRQMSEIAALGMPRGEETRVSTMLRLIQGDVRRIQAKPTLAGTAAFHDFAMAAHAYGLTACAPLS